MTEKDEAMTIAERILDKPGEDPDSDISILARQLLRALQSEAYYADRLSRIIFPDTTGQ